MPSPTSEVPSPTSEVPSPTSPADVEEMLQAGLGPYIDFISLLGTYASPTFACLIAVLRHVV